MAWKIFRRKQKQKQQEPPLYGNVGFSPQDSVRKPWETKKRWYRTGWLWGPVVAALVLLLLFGLKQKGWLEQQALLTGVVLYADNMPAVNVPVRFLNQVSFTDVSGRFEFTFTPRDSIVPLTVAGESSGAALVQNVRIDDSRDVLIVLPGKKLPLAGLAGEPASRPAAPASAATTPPPPPTSRFVFEDARYRIESGLTWAQMLERHKMLAKQDFHLGRITHSASPGNPALFSGVWYPGGERQRLVRAESWVEFVKKWREFQERELILVSLATFIEANHRVFVGVWQSGTTLQKIWLEQSWAGFAERHNQYEQEGYHLVDIETYLDRGVRKFAGIWEPALGRGMLRRSTGKSAFLRTIREAGQEGFHLVDMEIYREAGQTRYIGVWEGGSGRSDFIIEDLEKKFQRKQAEARANNLRLIDLEYSFPDQQKRVSAVWYSGDTAIAADTDL